MNTAMSLAITNVKSQSTSTQLSNTPKIALVNRAKTVFASAISIEVSQHNYMPLTKPLGMSRDYEALLIQIQHDGGCYLVKYGDKSVWINTNTSEVYLDFARDKIPGIDMASWKRLSTFNPPAIAKRVQLELWLFETLWQTSVNIDSKVADSGLFKLVRWPRPLSLSGRFEALHLAALIQAEPASVALLSSKTNYDESMVTRFLHAALLTGQVHQMAADYDVSDYKVSNSRDYEVSDFTFKDSHG